MGHLDCVLIRKTYIQGKPIGDPAPSTSTCRRMGEQRRLSWNAEPFIKPVYCWMTLLALRKKRFYSAVTPQAGGGYLESEEGRTT